MDSMDPTLPFSCRAARSRCDLFRGILQFVIRDVAIDIAEAHADLEMQGIGERAGAEHTTAHFHFIAIKFGHHFEFGIARDFAAEGGFFRFVRGLVGRCQAIGDDLFHHRLAAHGFDDFRSDRDGLLESHEGALGIFRFDHHLAVFFDAAGEIPALIADEVTEPGFFLQGGKLGEGGKQRENRDATVEKF